MADITAIILTKNEEKNITACIDSIKDTVKRIVVVDSGSTDKTVEAARKLGADVLVHEFTPFLYAKQFLYAMENANITTKWVLRIDADERLTKESAAEIEKLCGENTDTDVNGIILRFEVNFMGKKLKHGGIYPFKKLVLFKYGKGNIEDREMDEHINLFEGRAIEAKCDCEHIDYKDLTAWIDKHNKYSSREVNDYFAYKNGEDQNASHLSGSAKIKRFIKFKIYYRLPGGFRAWCYYFYRYILKGGFLDGKEGKYFAFMQAYWYRMLVDAKIREREKNS